MWTPISNYSSVNPQDGIIRLWSSPNIMDGDWRVEGVFGRDIFHYFFIPDGFYYSGGTFYYNSSGFKYQFNHVWVYTSNSTGRTDEFFRVVQSGNIQTPLNTDKLFKLPYLMFPDFNGHQNITQRSYFKPLGTNI